MVIYQYGAPLIQCDSLYKKGKFGDKHTHRENHVNMKEGISVMQVQAMGCQRLLANHQKLGERHVRISQIAPRSNQTCLHLKLGFVTSTTVRQYVSTV